MKRARSLLVGTGAVLLASCAIAEAGVDVVTIDRDDVRIDRSCTIRFAAHPIVDEAGDGVVQVVAPNITIEFEDQPLRGAEEGSRPEQLTGTGIRVTAPDVTLIGPRVHGFKVGIHASNADRLVIDGADVSHNFAQRLLSDIDIEDATDWLHPHDNDDGEWMRTYGAGIVVAESSGVTIRNVRARHTQNGVILDRVNDSFIYDNDCSFLSGWGLALWRSNRNMISRNALDFCVRGYSHGVYNRGQDSAGLLMFEQCSENVVVENSITHGGDGVFAYSGHEALGERDVREDRAWYEKRGTVGNVFVGNDCSDAAAHGLELTFAFDNQIIDNTFRNNAICGIWGGYSKNTRILRNRFIGNGDAGYGVERGGVNIEHGAFNVIASNRFRDNECGVHLWWDSDLHLEELPWTKANGGGCVGNVIAYNVFEGDHTAIQLRSAVDTLEGGNQVRNVWAKLDADRYSGERVKPATIADVGRGATPRYEARGSTTPVGARAHLDGRQHIIMGPYGPYDHDSVMLVPTDRSDTQHAWRVLGVDTLAPSQLTVEGVEDVAIEGDVVRLAFPAGRVTPYQLTVRVGDAKHVVRGVGTPLTWSGTLFSYRGNPIDDEVGWHREVERHNTAFETGALRFSFGSDGLEEAGLGEIGTNDRFGLFAETQAITSPGNYEIFTVSDDGLRVWLDGELVVDDWTIHVPRVNRHAFTVDTERPIDLRVEYFENTGNAQLLVELRPEG